MLCRQPSNNWGQKFMTVLIKNFSKDLKQDVYYSQRLLLIKFDNTHKKTCLSDNFGVSQSLNASFCSPCVALAQYLNRPTSIGHKLTSPASRTLFYPSPSLRRSCKHSISKIGSVLFIRAMNVVTVLCPTPRQHRIEFSVFFKFLGLDDS